MKLRLDWMAWLLMVALVAPIGCGDDDDDDDQGKGDHDDEKKDAGSKGSADSGRKPTTDDELEVAGEWTSEFGEQTISLDSWDGSEVVEFDNDENLAFTESPDDAMFSPGTFSKVVWTEPTDEGFYYCIVDYGLKTLAEAKASEKTADDSDPDAMGSCGGFTWTKLEPL
ncbi:MAG TPA: hypothetical protein VK506_03740 [Conexibacter sp.]|nr:hypothetical protein [Conexibacter sp.]